MVKDRQSRPGRSARFIGWYGLALGLLLAALQAARYRFWIIGHSIEFYIALIALVFLGVGIWAGVRFAAGRPATVAGNTANSAPDSSEGTEQLLERLGITPREYEVLRLIAQGLSNQEIASRLYVSLNTVKTHTSNLFAKLDAERRTQAVEKARSLGLLPADHQKG